MFWNQVKKKKKKRELEKERENEGWIHWNVLKWGRKRK